MIIVSLLVDYDQYSVVTKFAHLQVPLAYPFLLFHQVVLCLLHLPYFESVFFSFFQKWSRVEGFYCFLEVSNFVKIVS